MGTFASETGITAFEYDQDGNKTQTSFYPAASFQAGKRPEGSDIGSSDYLTHVFLADTPAALKEIVSQFPDVPYNPDTTSGSSVHVLLISSVEGVQKQTMAPFLIADNSNPFKVKECNQIHIAPVSPLSLPDGAFLKQRWVDRTPFLPVG